jgi:quinol monooxygenase YgiN/ketosteroid isomerase-like protein
MPTTKKTVDQFLTFLSKKDLDSLTLLFAENVNWSVPGNKSSAAPWLGQRNSRKEVREFYELLWENVEPITAKIKNIFIENEETVIAGEFTVKMIPTGNLVNSLFYIQMTVKNGLIVKYSLLGDSFAISESMVSRNLKSDDMMIRISEIEINSKYVNEYNSILEEESRASVQLEEGVIAIYPLFQKENPTQVRILEIYANREAYEAHLKTPHFQKYKTSTLKMVKSLKLMDMDNIDSQTMAEIFRKMQN